MTEPATGGAKQSGDAASSEPPRTGDEVIDEALQRLADLSEASLPEQHDRLSAVHEVLQDALDPPGAPGAPAPSRAHDG
jgi:hypothetical protein